MKSGVKQTTILSKHGNSSKPISVYANGSFDHPIKSSSAGIKFNISDFTLDICVGLDNIGISGSIQNNDISSAFGIKVDASELKLGFESSTTVRWDEDTSDTTYCNASITGAGFAALYYFAQTGQWVPQTAS